MEKKPSEGLSRTSIGDLQDNELTEILIRLPSCESAITCKLVSKRWLSLLSNPKFAIRYVKHKEEDEKEGLPWTLLSLVKQKLVNDDANESDKSFIDTHNKVFYNSSSKFSLKFLRRKFMVVATFKDLMLCFDTSRGCYLICNPVTKTWVALPPTTTSLDFNDKAHCWACLTCEDPFDPTNNNNTIDGGGYRFRIVVVPFSATTELSEGYKTSPFTTVNAIVFCSDNSEWIDIQVRVPLIAQNCESVQRVRAVLCKGMVCLHYDFHFGLFNPFDVTPGGTTALEARALPIPKPKFARSRLLECGGKLISVLPSPCNRYRMDKEGNLLLDYTSGIHVHLLYKELDLNQLAVGSNNNNNNNNANELSWKAQRGGGGSECIDKTGRSRSLVSGLLMTNVHPRNSHLFFIVTASSELLLCDRRSSSLKTLGRCELHPSSIHLRLELQHWPTPVPTILASNTN